MARRRKWSALSPSYRARLERAGIDSQAYSSGVPLSAARGHATTPERPLPATAPIPPKFAKWFNERYNNPIKMLTDEGEVWLVSVSKKDRSIIGSHWNATRAYLFNETRPHAKWWSGDSATVLEWFRDKTVRGSRLDDDGRIYEPKRYRFMVAPDQVEQWTYSDTLSFTTIYKSLAA
jgi:hypothetical protein